MMTEAFVWRKSTKGMSLASSKSSCFMMLVTVSTSNPTLAPHNEFTKDRRAVS